MDSNSFVIGLLRLPLHARASHSVMLVTWRAWREKG